MARLISVTDLQGQLARWAVIQHPYQAPPDLFDVVKRLGESAARDFTASLPGYVATWFESSDQLYRWLKLVLVNDAAVLAWNKPRSGHANNIGVSRYDGPAPEDDFIDLSALFTNIAHSAWKDAEEFQGESVASEHVGIIQ